MVTMKAQAPPPAALPVKRGLSKFGLAHPATVAATRTSPMVRRLLGRPALAALLCAILGPQAAAGAAYAAAPRAATVLKNEKLSATLDPSAGLTSLMVSAAAEAEQVAFGAGTDGWAVEVSALNSTGEPFTLSCGGGGGGCTLKSFQAGPEEQNATYHYSCAAAGYCVQVEYELRPSWNYLKKNIRLCKCSAGAQCLDSWEGTVRAVTHWTGLELPAAQPYVGLAVLNPVAGPSSFHPKSAAATGALAATDQSAGRPGGALQPTYIAGLWRSGAAGLFCSVMNPFGIYRSPNATTAAAAAAAPEQAAADKWVTYPGQACNDHPLSFNFGNVASPAACQKHCANESECVEWSFRNGPPAGACWGYNHTHPPHTSKDAKFTCGCRNDCGAAPPGPHPPPGPPPPPGPHPSPPPPPAPPGTTLPPEVHARFEPLFLQTKRHPALFEAEAAVLGLTALEAYDVDSVSGVNMGELRAFTAAVATSLLDGGAARKPVRVQVGWDSNDYQIDVGTVAGRTEYKRMLDRDASLGVTHAIYAPQNSAQSQINGSADMWGWEEALWIELGEAIRQRKWLPGRDAVPAEISEMIKYGLSKGVKLLAYAYPVLPFEGDGGEPVDTDGWLYIEKDNRGQNATNSKNCTVCEHRASLADPRFQDYLAETLVGFVDATGIGGFAWDYTGFKDWRQPSCYAEWRGWTRILAILRAAHPDIVMDHRQSSHIWGPWNHAAGSYTEPIAGDENPESYGAAGAGGVPTLSTDAVLANNLRRVNYVYRTRQLEPNVRIPGFMMHQSERHFDNRCDAKGHFDSQGIWMGCTHPGECACQGPNTGNFSEQNVRDFDFLGYRYGLLSSIGTAPLNNVLAMLPARDEAESSLFPAAEVEWINKWLNFTDLNYAALHNMVPLAQLDRGVRTKQTTNHGTKEMTMPV